jgi:hypothetical protein
MEPGADDSRTKHRRSCSTCEAPSGSTLSGYPCTSFGLKQCRSRPFGSTIVLHILMTALHPSVSSICNSDLLGQCSPSNWASGPSLLLAVSMPAPAILMRSSSDIVILGLCSQLVHGTWAMFEDTPSRKTKQVAPLDITPGNKNPRLATRGEA